MLKNYLMEFDTTYEKKALSKLEIEGDVLNLINDIY